MYTAEFYPTKIRATGLAMSGVFAKIAGILTPTSSTMLSDWHIHMPYIFFAGADAMAFIVMCFLEVETLHRPLDTLDHKKQS